MHLKNKLFKYTEWSTKRNKTLIISEIIFGFFFFYYLRNKQF